MGLDSQVALSESFEAISCEGNWGRKFKKL